MHIANHGKAFAHGTGVIRVPDTKTDFSFKIDTFVPGTSIVYPMQWTKTVVPGTHHVEVDLDYEGGRRTTWNGIVTIGDALANQLGNNLANVKPPAKKVGLQLARRRARASLFVVLVAGAIALRRSARRPAQVNYRAT